MFCDVFFFNDTATTEIYTLSLHDALPIWIGAGLAVKTLVMAASADGAAPRSTRIPLTTATARSEEHTSELQSHVNLVCRLLLEKKNSQEPTVRRRAHRDPLPPSLPREANT